MVDLSWSVSNLSVIYDCSPILCGLSFDIPKGVLLAIIGPNGAGKSTLLKASLGLVPALEGRVLFLNKEFKNVRKRIAYIPQRMSVDWDFPLTVFELVLMGCYGRKKLFRSISKIDKDKAFFYLEKVKMESFAKKQIGLLSGGQQQRVFLARALMQEAEIYLMDEPFNGIDLTSFEMIMNILKILTQEGKTVIIVHHDINTVSNFFDWVLLLNKYLISFGPIEKAFTEPYLKKAYNKEVDHLDRTMRLFRKKETGII